MEERVEAVRQYLFKESTKVRICERLQVSDKSFDVWRKQLEPEIFRRYDYKDLPLYVMKDKKLNKVVPVGESPAEELSRLRRENQLLKVHLEGYEILSRLAHEEYGIDLKKTSGKSHQRTTRRRKPGRHFDSVDTLCPVGLQPPSVLQGSSLHERDVLH